MSLKHLRTLVAVANHRTFSDAALSVRLTHAAVSQHMSALEADLGVSLFDRSTRTPTLNTTGRALVERAKVLLRDYDDLVPSILDQDSYSGDFILGVVPTALTGLAPRAIAILKESFPNLRLQIRPGLTGPLVSALERHELDAAVVTQPSLLPSRFAFEPIAEEPLRLVASRDAQSDDPFDLLRTQPFIRFNRNAVVGTQIEVWIQNQGVTVNDTMELDNLDAILSMVYANLGVSIVPYTSVAPFRPLPLKWINLGVPEPTRTLGFAYFTGTAKSAVVDKTVHVLTDVVDSQRDEMCPGRSRSSPLRRRTAPKPAAGQS
ncbi:MAG: LysR family transcriptional regulator [Paracoccaceae bacterium]|nr:LysR family transcriptional regulator [Paracoccaceae bacterium]